MSATRYSGRCACGAIRVHILSSPGALVYCHCGQCRKTAGAGFLAVVPVARAACVIEDAAHCLREYRASPDKARCFCGRCGSPILSRRDGADTWRLRAGLFDALPGIDCDGHIFVASAAPWDVLSTRAPHYPELEPARAAQRTGAVAPHQPAP